MVEKEFLSTIFIIPMVKGKTKHLNSQNTLIFFKFPM